MAEASGLQRLTLAERDPLAASTFGTGELLADAKARGARHAILAIGGSATNDAGIGAAAALGWKFLDANGAEVAPNGGSLAKIARIIPAPAPFKKMDVLCDVTNPLFGPHGAAWIYGRQKGGTDETLALLDDGLRHIAALVVAQLGEDVAATPGAGAAGGLGYGAMAFMDATLRRGIEIVLDMTGFDAAARAADLIITGEGHLDAQSAQGKLIQGLCGRAQGKPVIALCGKLSATPRQVAAIGLKDAISINREQRPLAEMLANTATNLEQAAAGLEI
jgi:glycerate kinase